MTHPRRGRRDIAPDRVAAAQVIAFYLPQFHPIPENDAWWGPGFTEWTNVVKAEPLFDGHEQPHLPADLGFYDLRVPEVREHQAALARAHGIDAFCYYHYWFGGRRVLDRVFDEVLRSGRPDFPFSLCWANENWTRAWDAGDQDVLLEQHHDAEEQEEHVRYLIDTFRDPRYVRVEDRPLFLIYRVQSLPDADQFIERLRNISIEAGLGDPYIVKFDTHGLEDDPAGYGCDAAAQFLPHGVLDRVTPVEIAGLTEGNLVIDYEEMVRAYLAEPAPPWTRHECVVPTWDNTPRRGDGRALLLAGSTPHAYERWLRDVVHRAPDRGGIVFVNAWNEWAEGAHLEPDERYGRQYLEATARAVLGREPDLPTLEGLEGLDAQDADAVAPRFAELYVDLYERCVRMQRRLTATEMMLQRYLDADLPARHLEDTVELVERLQQRIAELEEQLASLGRVP